MTNNNKNITEDSTFKGDGPGKLLAKGRQKAKLSERDAADALKISVSRLKSIEEDDFSVFPSETYIRGHLRNYSRLLKEDEKKILDAYNSIKPTGTSADLADAVENTSVSHVTQKRWWIVYIVLVVLALIWALSYWVLGADDDTSSVSGSEALSEQMDVTNSAISQGIASSAQVERDSRDSKLPNIPSEPLASANAKPRGDESSDSSDLAIVSDGFSPSSSELDSDVSSNDAEQPIVVSQLTASELVKSIQAKEKEQNEVAQKVIEGDTLQFGFSSASWVQVTDSTGTVLFKGLNKPGAELALNGKAPFRVVIGNVEGTSLVYNGESVSLDAPKGKNTLRLNLGG